MRRELKINTPILVISAMADMDIQVKVHNAGADDFMTKPIRDSKMLQIHCESLIRRQYEKKKKLIRYDKLLFDEETDSFFVGTEELRFSPHESSILSALMHKSRIRKASF
jgi:DNA-binding response OmpR family regulator